MLLSINIPTYNRSFYLDKNLSIIINQIRDNNLEKLVEINISDNASTDSTQDIVKCIIHENADLLIHYKRNDTNLGPDANYIQTMHMASAEFSILWGDDDFLKNGALQYIVEVIKTMDCSFFISNRTTIDGNGNLLAEQCFFYNNLSTRIFDFHQKDELISYLSHVRSLGACFTFISSIIYKTSIIKEMGEYDHCFDGTYYSFLYYWWGWLLKGNKICYLNKSYLYCTTAGKLNSCTFGTGIDRVLVDFKGFSKIADYFFSDKFYSTRFKSLVLYDCDEYSLLQLYYQDPQRFTKEILPYLSEFGWDKYKISRLLSFTSKKRLAKILVKMVVKSFFKRT